MTPRTEKAGPFHVGEDIDDADSEPQSVEDNRQPAILGLDLGTTTGWCVLCSDTLASGTWDLSGDRWEGGGMRFVRFVGGLADVAQRVRIVLVAYETVVRHASGNASQIYGGFLFNLERWCEVRRPTIPYVGLTIEAIKLFATGNAKASKDAMVKSCNDRWLHQGPEGGYVIDDNQADALWIAALALADDTWDVLEDGEDDDESSLQRTTPDAS